MAGEDTHFVHPTLGRRTLVWRADAGDEPLLRLLDGDAAVGTVAVSIRAGGSGMAAAARERGLGVLLLDDFEATSAAGGEACIDEQVAAGATLLTTPVGAGGWRDVELAAACADHVRARALRAPAADDPARVARELYATVVLRAEAVDDATAQWVVGSYGPLGVDGFLVRVTDFYGDRESAERVFALVGELQRATGRPVVVDGLGELWQAALAAGVAGAVQGPASLVAGAYHGAVLGTVGMSEDDEAGVLRRRLFIRHTCGCGFHPEGTAPAAAAIVRAHNAWWLLHEARMAVAGATDRAALLLTLRAAAAGKRRAKLGLAPLPTGWTVLADGDAVAEVEPESDARSDA